MRPRHQNSGWTRRGRPRAESEIIWVQTQLQGRGRLQSPGRPGNFMPIPDRPTGEFNLRMAVVPRTGSVSPVLGFRTILDVERFVTEHTAATGQLKSAAQTERPGPERVGPAARWPHLRP